MSSFSTSSENASIDPDVALMLRVQEDDAQAFEMLINRHQGKIQRFLLGWVSNAQQAEDLAQDVFLRVFKARKNYLPTAKFTTWLYRIANNVASNHIRDNANRREYQLSSRESQSGSRALIENIAFAPSGFQPTRQIDKSERASVIMQALQALGERQKTALMLSKFENMSYQEIADTMGLSVQAVKSLLSRARVNLKALLDPYMTDGQIPTATLANDDIDTTSEQDKEK